MPMPALAGAGALVDAGRPREAAETLRPHSEAAPADRALRIELAEALVAAGDPEGRAIATELLRDDPQSRRLFELARGKSGLDTPTPESGPPDDR